MSARAKTFLTLVTRQAATRSGLPWRGRRQACALLGVLDVVCGVRCVLGSFCRVPGAPTG